MVKTGEGANLIPTDLLGDPFVMREGDRPPEGSITFAIGLATSEDGIHWERNPNNPILEPRDGQWDAWSVQGPTAIIHNNEIWLWYFGTKKRSESLRANIGLAKFRLP